MKIVRVVYTAKNEYVSTNRANIEKVMSDLKRSHYDGIHYHVCLGADGRTFTHTAFLRSDADQQLLNELPSFKSFQDQLKASGPEAPPRAELLTLVASSPEIFNA